MRGITCSRIWTLARSNNYNLHSIHNIPTEIMLDIHEYQNEYLYSVSFERCSIKFCICGKTFCLLV